MRVAFISSQAFSLVNFRGSLIKDLNRFDVEVFALAPDFDSATRQQVLFLGAKPIDFSLARTGKNPVIDFICTLKLSLLLRRLQIDVTLGYFIKPVIYGTIAAWLAGVPKRIAMIEGLGFVYTYMGDAPPNLSRKGLRLIVSLLYRLALKKAHKVIFLNMDDIREFVDSRMVKAQKAVCIGGIGVDLLEWSSKPIITDPVSFIMVARLLREKGIFEYAEAARQVKARYPHVRFIILGGLDSNPGGINLSEVQAWVNQGFLEWPGHVKVKSWLEQASVFVLPSYREGVPRSTQEAMATGRPVITTDVPGCRETVVHGVNGYLIAPRNIDSLVKAMEKFITNPNLCKVMGRESRRIAEERFDSKKINRSLMSLLGVC